MKKAWLLAVLLGVALSAQAADKFGADRHVQKGISCEMCHGPDKANPEFPTIDTCTKCHNTKQLVEKTKGVKPTNPHTSPHYADKLDCTLCHLQHAAPENYCAQCHNFDFKVR